ncbi:trypsin-like peptidase domain-containing protein [Streptomyces bambusae]|uniref:S1C family serine protease n=1 Tax=Streptomyces bambusae TaxID=1550616 RepID=UPI001CFEEA8E|nr:trypsin-like peptidase domain-containing protein [Streptomyces bambusae]MCB5167475.1 trypsin-like peptidase domain-containing protein [Streptomyces bambusae]
MSTSEDKQAPQSPETQAPTTPEPAPGTENRAQAAGPAPAGEAGHPVEAAAEEAAEAKDGSAAPAADQTPAPAPEEASAPAPTPEQAPAAPQRPAAESRASEPAAPEGQPTDQPAPEAAAPSEPPAGPGAVWYTSPQAAAWYAGSTGNVPAPEPAPRPGRTFRTRHLVAACAGAALLAGVVGGVAGSLASGVEATIGLRSTAFAGDAGPQGAGPVPHVAAEALRSTVTIQSDRPGVQAVGTGFFFDHSGHILTNAHVVDPEGRPATKLTVTFSDGRTCRASVVGAAKGYDIAVIRLDGKHRTPPPLTLGNSDRAVIGEPVVAAGAPFDLPGTVTSGILSALNRPVTTQNGSATAYLNALQTDAPINPGNSGGPLIDEAGHVLGVNSAITGVTSPDGGPAGSVGLGFAIPINQAKWVAEGIIEHGAAEYAQLGFRVNPHYTGTGVQISDAKDGGPDVVAGGAADRAGLRPGDVITAIDGRTVANAPALMSAVWSHRPHEKAVVQYVREGRTHTVMVVLGARMTQA